MKKYLAHFLIGFVLLPGLLPAQTERPVVFARDSLQLVGMLHLPAEAQSKVPAVLFLHGFTGHKSDTHFIFTRTARALAQRGVAVLRFDFAGSADSQGEFADMTILTELADARAALEFLRQQPQIDGRRLGLLGFSMGGCVAALLAGESTGFQTLVLWAPVADPVQTFAYIPQKYEKKSFQGREVHDLHGFYVGEAFLKSLPEIHPLQTIRSFHNPVLIIQGSEDRAVTAAAGKAYADTLRNINPQTRLQMIEGSNHVFSTMEWTDQVVSTTADWFVSHLAKP